MLRVGHIEDFSFHSELKSYVDAAGTEWALPYRANFMTFINTKYRHLRTSKAKFQDAIVQSQNGILSPPFKYQEFILEYLRYGTPYRGLLLEHGLGSGKTRTAIMVAETFRAVGIPILILTPAFLSTNFRLEIKKWYALSDQEINAAYHFISYNAGGKANGQGSVLEQLAKLGIGFPADDKRLAEFPYIRDNYPGLMPPQRWFIIIEEMHGLNRSFSHKTGKIRHHVYDLLMAAKDCKFLGLSGTPMIEPYELATIYNILRGPIQGKFLAFPENREAFAETFLEKNAQGDEVLKNQDVFQKRICGLHSYFKGISTTISGKIYPKEIRYNVSLEMSAFQQEAYLRITGKLDNFMCQERKMCNFAYPEEVQPGQPIPYAFLHPETGLAKYSCKMYAIWQTLGDITKGSTYVCAGPSMSEIPETAVQPPCAEEFIGDDESDPDPDLDLDLDELHPDANLGLDLDLDPRPGHEGNKGDIYLTDEQLNAKYGVNNWTIKGGPAMIYSFFAVHEGAGIFSAVLKSQGFEEFRPRETHELTRKPRYAFIRGGMSGRQKEHLLSIFNHPANKHGQLIKVMFVTLAAVEGVSLFHLRQIHIMEPYWDRNITRQVTGRGFRLKSHFALPEDECNIHVFEYTATIPGIPTADVLIRAIADKKDRFQEDFKQLRMNAAVDSGININHHEGVHCFEFKTQDGFIYHADVNVDTQIKSYEVPIKMEFLPVKNSAYPLVWNPAQFFNIQQSTGERITSVHRVYAQNNMGYPLFYVKTDGEGRNTFYRLENTIEYN